MNRKIRTLAEIQDSKLLYEKDMPSFGYLIVLCSACLLVVIIIWSAFNTKPYIVKGSGIIESTNKNYVMTPFTGEMTKLHMEEGQYVSKGDMLFTVKSTDINVQIDQLNRQERAYEKQIKQYEKLIRSMKDNRNYFDESNSEDSFFYNQYETYKSQIEQQQIDDSMLKQYGYSDEQLERELEKNSDKKAEIYYTAISNAENIRAQLKVDLASLESQISAIEKGKADYQVKANTSGILHLLSTYKEGMVVQAANPVASIGSDLDEFVVYAYIAASDRPLIEENNKVTIEISGLRQSIYGTLSGKISNIDSDITTTEDGKGYFKVSICPDKEYLISKGGRKVNLSNGLQVEARVIYDEVTYLDYILEALGVKA